MYIKLKYSFNKALVLTIMISLIMGSIIVHAESNKNVTQKQVKWKAISVGVVHSLAVKEDGTVWAWGDNSWGQIGNGERGGYVDSLKVLSPVQVKGLNEVINVAAGGSSSFALKKDGTVWAWGSNGGGVLGNGKETTMESTVKHPEGEVIVNNDQAIPVQVKGISKVIALFADFSTVYALKNDGTVWGWSSKGLSQYPDWTDIVSITSGYSGILTGLKADGSVVASGRYGKPVHISNVTDMIEIAAGSEYTYGLKKDGTVWFWGSDGISQLLKGIQDVIAVQASAGGPLLLRKDGTVWTSGDNYGGQLGIGSYEDSLVPVQVKGLIRVKQIAASGIGLRSIAIKSDGSLWSWGNGYVGDGTKWYRTLPVWIKSSATEVKQEDSIIVEMDNKIIEFDQPPLIIKGRTMVPLRAIFESLGAQLQWDKATSTITATKGNTIIKISIGSEIAYINGQKIELDSPPIVINNRTLVPTRFIGESLGAVVTWEDASKTVLITSSTNDEYPPNAQHTL